MKVLVTGGAGFIPDYHASKVVNIGNPDERTVLDIAIHLIKVSGSTSSVVFRELPKDDSRRRCPDVSKARDLFGWSPEVGLYRGFDLTWQWFSGNLDRMRILEL